MNPFDYYGFPQRFMLGMPTEETPLALRTSQRLATALDYLKSTDGVSTSRSIIQDGKPTLAVGNGGLEARVYRPTTEEQATRNLNFAMANLQAYVNWDSYGRAEQARIEEAKRAAEIAAKRAADAEDAKKRLRETRLKNGLDLYNKINGTRAASWAFTHVSPLKQEAWAKQAEELATLQRITNPYSSSFFNSGGIASGMLRADSLYPTSYRL